MSIKQFGLSPQDIVRQPGFTISQNDQGGFTAQGVYEITRDAWESLPVRQRFRRRNNITLIDPDIEPFLNFFAVDTINVISDVGDTVTVSVNYSGSLIAQYDESTGEPTGDAQFTTRLELREREKCILTTPGFAGLAQGEQDGLSLLLAGFLTFGSFNSPSDSPNLWTMGPEPSTPANPNPEYPWKNPLTSALAIKLAKSIAKGDTTRTVHSVVWIYTTQGIGKINVKQLEDLNKEKSPPGEPPTPATCDWKVVGGTQEVRVLLVSTTLEYELSEPGGWPDLED